MALHTIESTYMLLSGCSTDLQIKSNLPGKNPDYKTDSTKGMGVGVRQNVST